MDTRIPFIIYGDGPRLPSGLGRIARDIAMNLVARQDELGIRFVQVGVDPPDGWHWQPWDLYGFQPMGGGDQGRASMRKVVEELTQEHGREPIVLMITDPSRCFDLVRGGGPDSPKIFAEWWGYFPIDAHCPGGAIGGPAAETVAECTRVLGYGRYGAGVLKQTLQNWMAQQRWVRSISGLTQQVRVPYLPHGIDPRVFHPGVQLDQAHEHFKEWAITTRLLREDASPIRIGCVATNQPRKDLGLLFAAVAELKAMGHSVALWLHTDYLVKSWAIGELASIFRFKKEEVAITMSDSTFSDAQLAAQYAWSDVTLAPGLGEGFGYPIVESLACGTPVVHVDYAGGVDLIPNRDWLVQPSAWRLEGCYAVERPVLSPAVVAETLLKAARWKRDSLIAPAYCSGAVAHLDWQYLWPRWESWIRQGLKLRKHLDNYGGSRGSRREEKSDVVGE